MNVAIEIKGLSKKYKRVGAESPYATLRDTMANILKRTGGVRESFVALNDISFVIKEGERVGIIGRNGAGKSTLLKIISQITPPSKGTVILNGRVASLLEVGTGFHPELTGKENIYLNGSILGLKRVEINQRLKEIIEFSGVEDFINMPLKNYSSGMQLRLAFSVAAHLEPEILLIDEVLAVGDIEFQKRCIGKMEEVSKKNGRTILFVSHNMNYISSFCSKGILLEKGKIVASGGTHDVISQYMESLQVGTGKTFLLKEKTIGDDVAQLVSLRMINQDGQPGERFKVTEAIGIEMKYTILKSGYVLWLGHNLHNDRGIHVFDVHDVNHPLYHEPHEAGTYTAIVWIPANFLNTGSYIVSSAIFNHLKQVIHFHVRDAFVFSIYDVVEEETARGLSPGDFAGVIRPMLNWAIKKE
jgi:lipopolysaccharide transport system ATP-binding protein